MATIRTECDSGCGKVELQPEDMIVWVNENRPNDACYKFACPECHTFVTKDAEPRIVELLVDAGVVRITWADPEEMIEIRNLHEQGAKPITHDDLIDFHTLLEGDRFFEELLSSYPEIKQSQDNPKEEHSDREEFDHETTDREYKLLLSAIKMQSYYSSLELGLMYESLRSHYFKELEQPAEQDPNIDGPGGDINNA